MLLIRHLSSHETKEDGVGKTYGTNGGEENAYSGLMMIAEGQLIFKN
jgi:hypothetical protein